jgi:hypothetical protein
MRQYFSYDGICPKERKVEDEQSSPFKLSILILVGDGGDGMLPNKLQSSVQNMERKLVFGRRLG